ncbi:hypothetical protein JDV02_006355 [Purpureocillium takamizusanense]|uniref:Uncharacterized protein n=1 Tax=Purpureocillium takamizusanense TaxID=2060973 RepID=A0A9Q8VCX2_9HYPO|nr:uncharacterized protein JDV02_006355 [Purpureocillium takamizusanense]UNI20252.1 hypothetical protein JDV02_006355 [Purpureocillium takamizusanense]
MPSSSSHPASGHHTSANSSRRTHHSSRPGQTASEYAEEVMEQLKNANTQLNKANSERDRYKHLYEQVLAKVSQSNAAKDDFKAQAQSLKEHSALLRARVQQLEDENDQLLCDNELWDKDYTMLEKSYSELALQHDTLLASMPASSSSHRMATHLPEKPKRTSHHKKKSSSSSTRREHKESSPSSRRSNNSNGDKDQKDRLSKRFEEKRSSVSGSRGSRRESFIEGWGPASGSSAPAAPPTAGVTGRSFAGFATSGLGQPPAVSPSYNKVSFSSVPRTAANPLSPGLYSTTAPYDGEYHDDGNYHVYPVTR